MLQCAKTPYARLRKASPRDLDSRGERCCFYRREKVCTLSDLVHNSTRQRNLTLTAFPLDRYQMHMALATGYSSTRHIDAFQLGADNRPCTTLCKV
jgi:hypothetical protein